MLQQTTKPTANRSTELSWQCSLFDALSGAEVYAMFELRQRVFVMEQTCLYADIDALDQRSWHLFGRNERGQLVAYLRIIPPSGKYSGPAIGRVVAASDARRHGLGKQLMHEGILRTSELFPHNCIFISAQTYLIDFYQRLGFESVGERFLEDGIEHIEMIRQPS